MFVGIREISHTCFDKKKSVQAQQCSSYNVKRKTEYHMHIGMGKTTPFHFLVKVNKMAHNKVMIIYFIKFRKKPACSDRSVRDSDHGVIILK